MPLQTLQQQIREREAELERVRVSEADQSAASSPRSLSKEPADEAGQNSTGRGRKLVKGKSVACS